MSDKMLVCVDCGKQFTFTAGEQDFYAQKGFTNPPSRCPDCRATRKAQRASGGYSGGSSYSGGARQMYPAVCAQCGKQTEVPFQPRGDKPVYCSDCFKEQQQPTGNRYGGGGRSGGGRSGGRDRDRRGGRNDW
ncbi:MAG: zinc-ribbon domain containing protein [Anaerolineae bacterium]|nr:zinc-ribbon domain containing protein [Anaerolineae bacterium]